VAGRSGLFRPQTAGRDASFDLGRRTQHDRPESSINYDVEVFLLIAKAQGSTSEFCASGQLSALSYQASVISYNRDVLGDHWGPGFHS
jgi:hypothetical protein